MRNRQELLSSSFRHLRFSLVLPVFSLVVAALCVGSVLPAMLRVSRNYRPPALQGDGRITIDPAFIEFTTQYEEKHRWDSPNPLEAIAMLDMPSMLGEIAISLPTTWPDSWHPRLSFPFDDLWFWSS